MITNVLNKLVHSLGTGINWIFNHKLVLIGLIVLFILLKFLTPKHE